MTMQMCTAEIVQVLCLTIATGSLPFLLGNYGVEGGISSNGQEVTIFNYVIITGKVALLVTAFFNGVLIYGDIKHDQDAAGEKGGETEKTCESVRVANNERKDRPEPTVTKLSLVWVGFGVVATTINTK